jgi:2-desacetyl-2-hydroxyethyl bacteriochlorophyllide A dehydrogenase
MRAAFIEQLGPPANIRYGELAVPKPGPADVLVDVAVTTVNHVDTFVRSGAWRTPVAFPFVIGRDLAGRVVEVGEDVSGFRAGDPVWCNSLGHAGRQGAAAQRAVAPADRLYHLPDGVDAIDAVAVAHPAVTAYLALFTHGRVRAAETVVVAGAGGNVGSALVALATEAGVRVIATASAGDAAYCRARGAVEVLDYTDPALADHLRELSPGGIDAYFDTAGHNDLELGVGLLARRGRIVLLAGMRTRPVLPAGALYLKDCSVVGFAISQASTSELAEAAAAVNRLLSTGELRPRATQTLPLSAAATAHRMVEAGTTGGRKLVLRTDIDP